MHIFLPTIVTECAFPTAVHSLSVRTQSWLENVAGEKELTCTIIICLPGPIETSQEGVSVGDKKED